MSRGEVASVFPGVRPLFRIRHIIHLGLHRISIPFKLPFLSHAYETGRLRTLIRYGADILSHAHETGRLRTLIQHRTDILSHAYETGRLRTLIQHRTDILSHAYETGRLSTLIQHRADILSNAYETGRLRTLIQHGPDILSHAYEAGRQRTLIQHRADILSHAYETGPADESGGGEQTTSHERLNVGGGRAIGPKFQALTVATVLCIFGLITLGGVVRLTGSGLGCPDWPLCHGQIIPPLEYHALIEYSHRMLAAVVGIMIVLQMLMVWLWHRNRSWLLIPSILGVVLVIVQGGLGGASVITELAGGLVLAHLATAEALVACMVVVSAVAIGASPRLDSIRFGGSPMAGLLRLTTITAAAGYVLLITGSYVTVSDAAISCGESWPLCNGRLFPEGHLAWAHMTHRVMSVLVGALAVGVLASAFRLSSPRNPLRWAALAVGASIVVQIGLGASIVTEGFTVVVRASHLSAGTLMWIFLVVLTFMVAKGQPDQPEGQGRA